MELGNLIKKQRADLGLTQEEVAKKLSVTRQTLSNWENEKSYPDLEQLL
ncbi:helix-turn-helix transcriptional regulator, partial [Lactobacillus gallinarum]